MEPMSPQQCLRSIAFPNKKPDFELCPVQYKPQDYLFIFTVTTQDDTNKSLVCKTVAGSELSLFFDTGKASIAFDTPLFTFHRAMEHTPWKAQVHVMRQQKVLLLAEHYQREVMFDRDIYPWYDYFFHVMNSTDYEKGLFRSFFRYWDSVNIELSLQYSDNRDEIGIVGFGMSSYFSASQDCNGQVEMAPVSETRAFTKNKVTFAHFLEAMSAWNHNS